MAQSPGLVGTTRGGTRAATIFSGIIAGANLGAAPGAVNAGSDTLFFSGAGVLNTVVANQALSGAAVTFYDAPAAVSGGPLNTSGHKILAHLPANTIGSFGVVGGGPLPIAVNTPFYSGLCAAVRSGCAGFTVTWTPDPTA